MLSAGRFVLLTCFKASGCKVNLLANVFGGKLPDGYNELKPSCTRSIFAIDWIFERTGLEFA